MKILEMIKLCEFVDCDVFDQHNNKIEITDENKEEVYSKEIEHIEASGDKVMIYTFDGINDLIKEKKELWESKDDEVMKLAIMAMLDRIESELKIQYWNKYQKELLSPFKNTGEAFETEYFTVKAYNWDFDSENGPNFETQYLKVWWYKHSNRGLTYKFKYGYESYTTLAYILAESIKSIDEYFKRGY